MGTIQAFLTVVLCGFVWLTIILGFVLAEEITICEKDWKARERIQDGKIYKMSRQDGKVAKVKKFHQKIFSGRYDLNTDIHLCALGGFA